MEEAAGSPKAELPAQGRPGGRSGAAPCLGGPGSPRPGAPRPAGSACSLQIAGFWREVGVASKQHLAVMTPRRLEALFLTLSEAQLTVKVAYSRYGAGSAELGQEQVRGQVPGAAPGPGPGCGAWAALSLWWSSAPVSPAQDLHPRSWTCNTRPPKHKQRVSITSRRFIREENGLTGGWPSGGPRATG